MSARPRDWERDLPPATRTAGRLGVGRGKGDGQGACLVTGLPSERSRRFGRPRDTICQPAELPAGGAERWAGEGCTAAGEGCTAAGEGCTAAGEGCVVRASSSLTVTIIDSWVEAVAVVTVEVVVTVVGFRGLSRERGGQSSQRLCLGAARDGIGSSGFGVASTGSGSLVLRVDFASGLGVGYA